MLFGDEGQTELKCALQTCYALELSCIGQIIQEKGWKFPSRYSFNCVSFTSLAHYNHYFARFEVLFQKDLMHGISNISDLVSNASTSALLHVLQTSSDVQYATKSLEMLVVQLLHPWVSH